MTTITATLFTKPIDVILDLQERLVQRVSRAPVDIYEVGDSLSAHMLKEVQSVLDVRLAKGRLIWV